MQDELKLLSSLNTLGYIEFDILCNLNNLNEKLFHPADLTWISKHTYHVIGKYDSNGEYMVHRVYISSNCGSHYIDEYQNKVKGYYTTNHIISRSTCSSLFILSQQVQFQEGEQY